MNSVAYIGRDEHGCKCYAFESKLDAEHFSILFNNTKDSVVYDSRKRLLKYVVAV